jgi:anthranilate phosphoribosyltransferase
MSTLLRGEVSAAQTGAFLMGLRSKGETEEEVVGLLEAMQEAGVKCEPHREPVMDLCGTGGDCSGTFNISTAASLVVAAAGVAVAKHGNRSASSRCGSADVLEALGVPLDLPPDRVCLSIEEHGFGFLFAPLYHPAMKHVAVARRELRFRTIFNSLGPLANPARVKRQLLGVFDGNVRARMAGVLRLLGSESVWVVHGHGGLDELSLSGPSQVTVLAGAAVSELAVHPGDCGLPSSPVEALRGGDPSANAAIIRNLLSGERGPRRDAVVFNAAAALVVAGSARDLQEGAERAQASLDSGSALKTLDALRRFR